MKYKLSAKRKQLTYVPKHHILPKSTFGENDETDWFYPKCHTDYPHKLGTQNLKNPDMVFNCFFITNGIMACLSY